MLVVAYIGDRCAKFLDMSFKSILDADKIIFVWGMEDPETWEKLKQWEKQYPKKFLLIKNKYDQNDKGMNGKARNIYLNYLKELCPDEFALVLDPDEIVDNFYNVRQFVKETSEGIYSVKMRHLISDLGHEDATLNEHWVPNRLFKISEADKYPEVEHPVLLPKQKEAIIQKFNLATIWHLAYCPNSWEYKRRYENHIKKSNIHTPDFLKNWYCAHLFGVYPRKEIPLYHLPRVILEEFNIDPGEIYFQHRGLEMKHTYMVRQWNEFFKPLRVLDLGCGRGPHLFFWEQIVKHCEGIDLDRWAFEHKLCNSHISNMNILDYKTVVKFDLVTCIDVLEHLEYGELDLFLNKIKSLGKNFLFSIPFLGDPNLLNDPTHKIFKSRDWWVDKIKSKGLEQIKLPEHWFFKEQLLAFMVPK